jgi:hypothetical protein
MFEYFSKISQKIQISLKSDKTNGCFTIRYAYIYDDELFLEWEIFRRNFVEKIKTLILFSETFIPNSRCLWVNVEKYHAAGQATDGDMVYALCMLDT